ncbi:MAG: extracellular solute-binding protein [Pseudomonadota bacterium]|nr:extracellular solute-binding protein [Pseudomonadota bacterium]
MTGITRRDSLVLGGAALGVATVPLVGARAQGDTVPDVPMADVKPPGFKIEKGASLHVIRPAKFIDPDQVYWELNTAKFTQATGIPVRVNYISWEDLRPQTAVIANTGAGADIVVGFSSDPFIYASKLVPMSDLCDYLGAKYGGWFDLAKLYGRKWKTEDWISVPIGGGTGPTVYRMSWVKEAGYDTVPDDLDGFLTLCQKLKKIGHPCGFSLGHALGDANGFAEWALWSHGGGVVDAQGKVMLDSKPTLDAMKYVTELYQTMIPGTLSWNDSGNNKAFAAGSIALTFNGVSIYYVLKSSPDPNLQAIAKDTNHVDVPRGVAPRPPRSAAIMNAMLFKHSKFPNAAKEYLRFMMEAPQYGPWLSNCIGYWSEPLKSYAKMKFWTEDPKLKPYAGAMDTIYYDGYAGPITAASSAVAANYTIVDMFAAVATGNAAPQSAAKQAARQAARYYKT